MTIRPKSIQSKRIRAAVKNAGKVINVREVSQIIRAALDKNEVTPDEREDLNTILRDGKLLDAARMILERFAAERFRLLKGRERSSVARAIRREENIGQIQFRDPLNKVAYTPCQFREIARQVDCGTIKVFEFEYDNAFVLTGKRQRLGFYHWHDDALFVRKPQLGEHELHWQSTLIHEATHVIQDKLNVPLKRWDAEAAAHIAQAVMLLGNKVHGARLFDYLKHAAFRHAADKIRSGDGEKLTRLEFRAVHQAIKARYPTNDRIAFDDEWHAPMERMLFWLATRGRK